MEKSFDGTKFLTVNTVRFYVVGGPLKQFIFYTLCGNLVDNHVVEVKITELYFNRKFK